MIFHYTFSDGVIFSTNDGSRYNFKNTFGWQAIKLMNLEN